MQFGLVAVLFAFGGAKVTAHLSSAMVTLVLGGFLLCYAAVEWRGSNRLKLPPHPAVLVGGGMCSGFVAGLIGTSGAIRSACLLVFGLPKDVYLGTSAAIVLVVDATRIPVYLGDRLIPKELTWVIVSLVVSAFAGAWCGRRCLARVSPQAFRRLVLGVLTLAGCKFLWDGWHGLA